MKKIRNNKWLTKILVLVVIPTMILTTFSFTGAESTEKQVFKCESTGFTVTAKTESGNISDDVYFIAETEIPKNVEEKNDYEEIEKKIRDLCAENEIVEDLEVYDIYFKNSSGKKIEPSGDVSVSIEYDEPKVLLESREEKNIKLAHIKSDNTIENVEIKTERDENKVTKVEFTTDCFSKYVIYSSKKVISKDTENVSPKSNDFKYDSSKKGIHANKYVEVAKDSTDGRTFDMTLETWNVREKSKAETVSGLSGYTIRNYIDPRFDLLDDSGDIITKDSISENGKKTTVGGKTAQLYYDSECKMHYIEWTKQDIPSVEENCEVLDIWSATIRIQAKMNFLGGNNVLIDGNIVNKNKVFYPGKEDSKSTDDKYPAKSFSIAKVNSKVKEINNVEPIFDTVDVGHEKKADDIYLELIESLVNGNKEYREIFDGLSIEQNKKIKKGENVKVNYSGNIDKDKIGEIEFSVKDKKGKNVAIEDFRPEKETDNKAYMLKITYCPLDVQERECLLQKGILKDNNIPKENLVGEVNHDTEGYARINLKANEDKEYTDVSFEKVWNDSGHEDSRPESIGVKLLVSHKTEDEDEWSDWKILDPDHFPEGTENLNPVTIKPDEEGEWPIYKWVGLLKKAGKTQYRYKVEEIETFDNYTSHVKESNEGIFKAKSVVAMDRIKDMLYSPAMTLKTRHSSVYKKGKQITADQMVPWRKYLLVNEIDYGTSYPESDIGKAITGMQPGAYPTFSSYNKENLSEQVILTYQDQYSATDGGGYTGTHYLFTGKYNTTENPMDSMEVFLGEKAWDVYEIIEYIDGKPVDYDKGDEDYKPDFTNPELGIRKYVEKYSNHENKYKLSLTATGKKTESTTNIPVDILFIIDTTGSMKAYMHANSSQENESKYNAYENNEPEKSRWHELTESVNGFIGNIKQENIDARYAAITFASEKKDPQWGGANVTRNWKNSDSVSSIDDLIPENQSDNLGGTTNYEAAFRKLNTCNLLSENSDRSKIVVFITDGSPNTMYSSNGHYLETRYDITAWEAARKELCKNKEIDALFTIGLSNSMTENMKKLESFTNQTNAKKKETVLANRTGELKDHMNRIAKQFASTEVTNASIHDILSTYVKPADQAKLYIDVYDNKGRIRGSKSGDYSSLVQLEVDGTVLRAEYIGGEINLYFPYDYVPKEGWEYIVSVDIAPTDETIQTYGEEGGKYPHIGESDTGETSAGFAGVYTNEVRGAIYRYEYGGRTYNQPYPKPVIQVKGNEPNPKGENHFIITNTYRLPKPPPPNTRALIDIQVKKEWKHGDNLENDYPEDLIVYLKQINTNDEVKKTYTSIISDDDRWKHEWRNLPKYDENGELYNYVVSEVTPKNYIRESITKNKITSENSSNEEYIYTITNRYSKSKGITVRKIWDDRRASHEPVKVRIKGENSVDEEVILNEKNNWTTNLNIAQGEYTVTEEGVPEGYKSMISGGKDARNIGLRFPTNLVSHEIEETDAFQEGQKHVIKRTLNGKDEMLIIEDGDPKWVTYNLDETGKAEWLFDSSRHLINDGYYLYAYKKTYMKADNEEPHSYSKFSYTDGHLFVQKKSGGTEYYLTKENYFTKKAEEDEKVDITLYTRNIRKVTSVKGDENHYYVVNKPDDIGEEIDPPKIEKQIDSLVDNIEDSESYQMGQVDDNNVSIGTSVRGREDYRLRLTLEGTTKEKGVDLLFVVDNTQSMGGDKIEKADEIVNGTKENNYQDGMLSRFIEMNKRNKVALTTFVGGKGNDYESNKYKYNPVLFNWTRELPDYNSNEEGNRRKIACNSYSGTNYMGALLRADEMITDPLIAEDGNQKAVIFITDGEPNQCIKYDEDGKPIYSSGSGNNIGAIQKFVDNNTAVDFDCIGIGSKSHFDILENMASIAKGECYTSENIYDLEANINKIFSRFYPKDVKITDPLSQYVELNKIPDLEIVRKYIDKDGVKKTAVVWTMPKGKKFSNSIESDIGEATSANKWDSGKQDIIKTVRYAPSDSEKSTGKIEVEFNPEYMIGANNEFELLFNVKATEEVNKEYAKNNFKYSQKGDLNTDFDPGNIITSSDKLGFYANEFKNDGTTRAKVEYTQNSEVVLKLRYPRPVVQAALPYELPSVGKPFGTWIYTIFGSAMICFALMRARKKRHDS